MLYAQDNWKTLEQDNYTISYPDTWISSDEKPQPSIRFLLLSEETSGAKDMFRENINLTTENLGDRTISLKEYSEFSIDQVKAQFPSAELISNMTIDLNENKATSIIWKGDFGNNNITLKFRQLFFIKKGTAYALTFSSSEAEFDHYSKIANSIFNSFKIN
ncbi:hypothetical protein A9Q86_00370 [Flavobacteriales bacterium 33_180_T64]|nr:hypothetical protein A9Q86_00370 [Flavobacteriales bacterium 33_180_T64]